MKMRYIKFSSGQEKEKRKFETKLETSQPVRNVFSALE